MVTQKKPVIIIMMLYKTIKAMVCTLDSGTDLLDIVAGVLHKDILASYVLKICLDHQLGRSTDRIKENVSH